MKTKLSFRLFILITSFFIMNSVAAQGKLTRLDSLQTQKWYTQGLKDMTIDHVFYRGHYIETLKYKKDKVKLTYDFYLSNEIDTIFQSEKIGKNTGGKYLVVRSVKKQGEESFYIKEILEFKQNYMKVKVLHNSFILEYIRKDE